MPNVMGRSEASWALLSVLVRRVKTVFLPVRAAYLYVQATDKLGCWPAEYCAKPNAAWMRWQYCGISDLAGTVSLMARCTQPCRRSWRLSRDLSSEGPNTPRAEVSMTARETAVSGSVRGAG